MDQPTAGEALKRLEPLVGEWILEAKPPDGPPWPGEARATIEWHDSGAHLVQRSTVDMPEAPDSISIMGCDAANGTYYQLYSDDRGRLSRLRDEHRRWRVEALAGGRALPPALHRQSRGRRQHDRWPLGEGGRRHELQDRLRPDLQKSEVSRARAVLG
jgi:hypothetical protein